MGRKSKKRGLIRRIAKGGARIAKKGLKMAGRVAATTALMPLMPFKPTMKKLLEKKGVATRRMPFPEIVKQFYNKIVRGSKHMDEFHLEVIPEHIDLDHDNFVADTANAVKEIIRYFKRVKTAVKNNLPQSKDDQIAGEDAEQVEEGLNEEAREEASEAATEMLPDEGADDSEPDSEMSGEIPDLPDAETLDNMSDADYFDHFSFKKLGGKLKKAGGKLAKVGKKIGQGVRFAGKVIHEVRQQDIKKGMRKGTKKGIRKGVKAGLKKGVKIGKKSEDKKFIMIAAAAVIVFLLIKQ